MSCALWIATAGGLGFAPIAPGTFGSLGGAALFLALLWVGFGDPALCVGLFLAMTSLLFGLGIWASSQAEREWARHDDNRIVIDEVVGQLIALSPLVFFSHRSSYLSPLSFSVFLWVVTGFVLFRLFDVWKPGAIGWAERRFEGGLGVMADDVVAGLYSAVVVALALGIVSSWTESQLGWSGVVVVSEVGIHRLGQSSGQSSGQISDQSSDLYAGIGRLA